MANHGKCKRRKVLIAGMLASAMIGAPPAAAQSEGSALAQRGGGDDLTIYLMTMGPGAAVWERFGHNALLVRDHAAGTDIAYNYGMFSFDQENFLLRFIRGQMDYWMEGIPGQPMVDFYVQADRSVWLQELNLTPSQRAELRDFLEWNAQPENRFYRYDYYRDNCSTRVRDAIDLVLGGQLREQTEGRSTGTTYRDHTRALTIEDPLLYAGLMAGLGPPVDRPISVWEEMFLPMRMRELVRDVSVRDESGALVPLVRGEQEIYRSTRDSEQPIPSGRPLVFLAVGLVLAGALAFGGRRVARNQRGGWIFPTVAITWSFVAGLIGVILLGLWGFTDHAVAYRNENVLFLSPFLLMLSFVVPVATRRRGGRAARTISVVLGITVAVISLAGLVLEISSSLSQDNAEIIALATPINLVLGVALVWIWKARREGDPTLQMKRFLG